MTSGSRIGSPNAFASGSCTPVTSFGSTSANSPTTTDATLTVYGSPISLTFSDNNALASYHHQDQQQYQQLQQHQQLSSPTEDQDLSGPYEMMEHPHIRSHSYDDIREVFPSPQGHITVCGQDVSNERYVVELSINNDWFKDPEDEQDGEPGGRHCGEHGGEHGGERQRRDDDERGTGSVVNQQSVSHCHIDDEQETLTDMHLDERTAGGVRAAPGTNWTFLENFAPRQQVLRTAATTPTTCSSMSNSCYIDTPLMSPMSQSLYFEGNDSHLTTGIDPRTFGEQVLA